MLLSALNRMFSSFRSRWSTPHRWQWSAVGGLGTCACVTCSSSGTVTTCLGQAKLTFTKENRRTNADVVRQYRRLQGIMQTRACRELHLKLYKKETDRKEIR